LGVWFCRCRLLSWGFGFVDAVFYLGLSLLQTLLGADKALPFLTAVFLSVIVRDERSDEESPLQFQSDDEPVGGFGPGEAGGSQATVEGGGNSVVMEDPDKDKDHVFLPVVTGKKTSVPGAPVTDPKSLAQNAVPGETDEAAP
jgi:hypothetical protein